MVLTMATPKKKTTIKKTTPKKKIGKDLTDVKGFVKGGNNPVYKDKQGNTRIINKRKEDYVRDVITVSKQGKSGWSTVKEKTGIGFSENDARKGRVAPIANPAKAAEGLRRTSTYLNKKRKKK